MVAGGALGAPRQRLGGRVGFDGVLRAVRGRRAAQVAVRAADDAEGVDLRVRDGVVSSRGLARKLQEDVAFRVLAAENFPSHRTLCEFRRRHLGDFKRMFVQVVRLAAETGVANFGKLSIDGTKVRANASKRKAMSYSQMREEEKRLQGEIEALLDRAQVVDAEEDACVALGREGRRAVELDAEKHPAKARMAKKLATEAGRARYAERKWLSEAPIGWIKEALGFRRFSVRGLNKVQGEWDLVCLALNVKRMQGLEATA